MRIRMTRCIRTFALVCAVVALALPVSAAGTPEAAQELKKILGTPVFPADIQVRPVADVYSWPVALDYIETALLKPGTTYLEVHVRDVRFTSAWFRVRPAQRPLFSNASFVLAYSAASDMVRPITCSVQACGQQLCQAQAVSSLSGICSPSSCNTNAHCSGLYEVKNCTFRMCSPFGHCNLSQVQVPADRPCPGDGCYGDSDCPQVANTKTCPVKRCSGTFYTCDSYNIEVDDDAPCPSDECQSDNECDNDDDDGGLLDDILESQGWGG